MRLALAAVGTCVSLLALSGCDMSRARTADRDASAQLSGAIPIPEEFAGNPADFCGGLDIRTSFSGIPVGHTRVYTSDTGCTYSTERIPPNTEVELTVQEAGPVTCMKGSLVTVSPSTVPLKLAKGESRVLDFQANCGG